jgi:hypothetical protein
VILKISVVTLSGAGPGKYNSINNSVMNFQGNKSITTN